MRDRLLEIDQERAGALDKIAEKERIILEFQEKQQQLEFLEQQMKLLEMIHKYGLDPAEFLEGIALGPGASLTDLLEAMIRAMQAAVTQASGWLEAPYWPTGPGGGEGRNWGIGGGPGFTPWGGGFATSAPAQVTTVTQRQLHMPVTMHITDGSSRAQNRRWITRVVTDAMRT